MKIGKHLVTSPRPVALLERTTLFLFPPRRTYIFSYPFKTSRTRWAARHFYFQIDPLLENSSIRTWRNVRKQCRTTENLIHKTRSVVGHLRPPRIWIYTRSSFRFIKNWNGFYGDVEKCTRGATIPRSNFLRCDLRKCDFAKSFTWIATRNIRRTLKATFPNCKTSDSE